MPYRWPMISPIFFILYHLFFRVIFCTNSQHWLHYGTFHYKTSFDYMSNWYFYQPTYFSLCHTLTQLLGPHPIVDEGYSALTLRAFLTKQTLVNNDLGHIFICLYCTLSSSCDFFLLSLRHAHSFESRCGTQVLQVLQGI